MTMLDSNRAKSMLAKKLSCNVSEIKKMIIWGNHSPTMFPDFENALKDLEREFKKRLLSQQSSSDLKGFRKGKAPLDVIEKYYGDQIKQRLIMDKMGDIFYKKISEENIKRFENLLDPFYKSFHNVFRMF